jgi:hypothetical protein
LRAGRAGKTLGAVAATRSRVYTSVVLIPATEDRLSRSVLAGDSLAVRSLTDD